MKRRENHKVQVLKILGGLFYTFCLFQLLGIAIYPESSETSETLGMQLSEGLPQGSAEGSGLEREISETANVEDKEKGTAKYENSPEGEKPRIALTFDDGPNSSCTGRLLDGLKERGVKATFFLIGENAKKNPELVKRLDEEGHLIGNHTYHHVEITKVSDEEAKKEILDTDEVIYSIIGKHVEYMRPPFGLWQRDLELEIEVMPVMWTIDPLDWTTKNVDEIVNKVVTEAGEDDIILLHDCYDSSVDAALRIVDIMQKEGFEFVTVDELIMN